MKKIVILLAGIIMPVLLFAQSDSLQLPYVKNPTFPPARLLMIDSTVHIIKDELPRKRPILLMVFSPTCEHCKHETEDLVKNIQKFKKITIVMATMQPWNEMMAFRNFYGLGQYENIYMGKDVDFFLPPFYNIKNLPFLAFYSKKGELINVFSGSLPLDKVLEEFEK
jgi:thioredoxin-related protein